jgi:hypothetical protein
MISIRLLLSMRRGEPLRRIRVRMLVRAELVGLLFSSHR